MFDKIYVVVETNFYGPTYGYICTPPVSWDQLEDIFGECITLAADEYAALTENMDVPFDTLWEDVHVTGVSTFRPSESYIEWINLD